jgi:hypothetical protein
MANGHSAEAIEATFSADLRGPDGIRAPLNAGWEQQEQNERQRQETEWQKEDEAEMMIDGLSQAFKRPFPIKEVLSRPGKGSTLLHYIDARSVMKRLDDVVGMANWQTKIIETASGTRVLCELSVKIEGEWITKTDGSGDTDFEKEKGAISRALCRAATHFGIGRYLYNPSAFDRNNNPATWATPEGYDKMIAARADPSMYTHIE